MRVFVFLIVSTLMSSCGGIAPDVWGPEPAQQPQTPSSAGISVIDGDSVRINGENTRLMGFDTPETFRPKCALELELGRRATENLKRLLRDAQTVAVDYKLKRDGTWSRDKYRRPLAKLFIDDRDVANLQISAGLARAYNGRGKRLGWCG